MSLHHLLVHPAGEQLHENYLLEKNEHSLHEIFKSKFLRKRRFWRGNTLTTIGSTSSLSLKEMSDFISAIILEANELGIEVPPPVYTERNAKKD